MLKVMLVQLISNLKSNFSCIKGRREEKFKGKNGGHTRDSTNDSGGKTLKFT